MNATEASQFIGEILAEVVVVVVATAYIVSRLSKLEAQVEELITWKRDLARRS